jgi:protein-tyrosine phosphatase
VTMKRFNFAPASNSEELVFGAQRPGYPSGSSIPDTEVDQWVAFMAQQGITRVCCLLDKQLSCYKSDLLAAYKGRFGEQAVCGAPIEDYKLASEELLTETILPFLDDSVRRREKVVVHCSAGFGRTGHVLAAWLVYGRQMTNEEALAAVVELGRNPHEAAGSGPAGVAKLNTLLDACRASVANQTVSFPSDLHQFVVDEKWVFAKTFAGTWPHEYIVREKVDEGLFTRLVEHIRAHGYQGSFYKKTMTYYDEDGLVYWTMGAPVEETTIINRCTKEQTYEYRLAHDDLPT